MATNMVDPPYSVEVKTCCTPVLMSPTGFEGFCHYPLSPWAIPFQGMVEAA